MSVTVRIVLSTGDQIRVYEPSPQELHSFVPNGQLVAQMRACHEGYRVYHQRTETSGLHLYYADALASALDLNTQVRPQQR